MNWVHKDNKKNFVDKRRGREKIKTHDKFYAIYTKK
jgi:hypothetical protein